MSTTEETQIEIPKGLPRTLHKDKLVEIANYVLEGLSEDESCVLAGFDPGAFKEIKQNNAQVAMYLHKKAIEFKRKHLRTIGAKPNERNSMWLLESLRPEEFGSKKKSGDTNINIIGAILKDVQANNELSVKAQEGGSGKTREGMAMRVEDALK